MKKTEPSALQRQAYFPTLRQVRVSLPLQKTWKFSATEPLHPPLPCDLNKKKHLIPFI